MDKLYINKEMQIIDNYKESEDIFTIINDSKEHIQILPVFLVMFIANYYYFSDLGSHVAFSCHISLVSLILE